MDVDASPQTTAPAATTATTEVDTGEETTAGQVATPPGPVSRPRTLASNREHVCALTGTGEVACWGAGQKGQIAPGIAENQPTPKIVPGIRNAVQVLTETQVSCVRTGDGEAICWGRDQPALWRSRDLGDVVDLVLSSYGHLLCGIRRDQTVACTKKFLTEPAEPLTIAGVDDAIALDARSTSMCALRANKELVCWSEHVRTTAQKTIVPGVIATGVVAAAASGDEHCYEQEDGTQHCARVTTYKAIVPIKGPLWQAKMPPEYSSRAQDFSGNYYNRCLRTTSGNVECWGYNRYGERGTGVVPYRSSATPVFASTTDVTNIALGDAITCVIHGDHEIDCLEYGEPWQNPGVAGVRSASVGTDHACAIVGGGQLRCWGDNLWGALGVPGEPSGAVRVTGLSDATFVAVGADHSCAALRNNSVLCWGGGDSGQLGDGRYASEYNASEDQDEDEDEDEEIQSNKPLPVDGIAGNVKGLALGMGYSLALTDQGIYGWGLVPDPLADQELVLDRPTKLASGRFLGLWANGTSFCTIDSDHKLLCGGDVARNSTAFAKDEDAIDYDDELGGYPEAFFYGGPLWRIDNIKDVQSVAVGEYHVCTLDKAGRVSCWGRNTQGQLGIGTTRETEGPVHPLGVTDVVELQASTHHTCARTKDAKVLCWGANLGPETEQKITTPQQVSLPPYTPVPSP